MTKDKTQLLRLIFIDRRIRDGMHSGQLANCRSMAEEYEVSTKSIMRDIDYLKHQRDAPLAYDQQKKGYYYTEENYSLPAISLSESDIFAIFIAEKTLKQYESTPVYQTLVRVFDKIAESLPEKISFDPALLETKFSMQYGGVTRIDPETWNVVASGLKTTRQIAFTYRKPKAAADQERHVDPYHIMNYQGEWYLFAFCHRRRDIRTFAISRIVSPRLLPQQFTMAADFDIEKEKNNRFGVFGGKQEFAVRIRFFKNHTPYILEREWRPDQQIDTDQDGNIILSFTVNHLFEVKRWLLSWGAAAQVLGPEELIRDIRQELKAMSRLYKSRK